MYLAGALHDIGEMAIGNEILEKPDCHNIMGVARYRLEYNIEKRCKKNQKTNHFIHPLFCFLFLFFFSAE